MRATISFEADVSRVNDIMRSLVLEESNALQDALVFLEKATTDRDRDWETLLNRIMSQD